MCSFLPGEESEFEELSTDSSALINVVKYNMRKSLDLDEEGCYLQASKRECLEECGFNATAKTIFIIHGWTVRQLKISSRSLLFLYLGDKAATLKGTSLSHEWKCPLIAGISLVNVS